jgi:hypothetical protein
MTTIRAAAAILALCGLTLPAMAQNTRPTASNLPSGLPAPPPPGAIPGTLDVATGQFTPLTTTATRLTLIDKVYTFTPDFKQIQAEAAVIHTVTCYIFFPIVSNGGYPNFQGYAQAMNQFDLENPPAALSVRVFFTSIVPNPNATINLECFATDDNDEEHSWYYYSPTMPIDKLPTSYGNAVVF